MRSCKASGSQAAKLTAAARIVPRGEVLSIAAVYRGKDAPAMAVAVTARAPSGAEGRVVLTSLPD
jgi:hypothetical protein